MSAAHNVLLVVLDTARADAFEPYGAPAGSSPAVADLGSRGTVVRNAYAPSSWTMPSHASLFGGLSPRALGLGQAPDTTPASCRAVVDHWSDRWLPELARRAGRRTRAVSCNVWVSRASGFDLGFEQFVDTTGSRRPLLARPGVRARLQWDLQAARARVDAGARDAREAVERWLAEPGTEPFLWFVNLLECHSPYLPPQPWDHLGLLDRLRAGEEARRHLDLASVWRATLTATPPPQPALERMRQLYARAVRLMDDWLAGVLEELDRRRMLEDTLVVVTSDHGENFGEQGRMGHCFSVDERLVRVPLVTAGPGQLDADRLTTLTDLPRRLAGALGLDPSVYDDDPATGDVAVSVLEPMAAPGHEGVADAVRRWGLDDIATSRFFTAAGTATDGRWRLVRDASGEQWYDVATDPLGRSPVPVAVVPADVADRLTRAVTLALDEPHPPPAAGRRDPLPAQDDVDALEEQMRMLGYL